MPASALAQALPASANQRLARARPGVERIGLMMLWLMGASCSLVFIEPSPYEIATVLAFGTIAIAGLTIQRALIPLAFLLILTNIGYTISASSLQIGRAHV